MLFACSFVRSLARSSTAWFEPRALRTHPFPPFPSSRQCSSCPCPCCCSHSVHRSPIHSFHCPLSLSPYSPSHYSLTRSVECSSSRSSRSSSSSRSSRSSSSIQARREDMLLHHIASHRIASHRIASHRIASHRIAPLRSAPHHHTP